MPVFAVFALNDAMAKLNDLTDDAEYFHKPIIITGKRAGICSGNPVSAICAGYERISS